MERHTTLKKSLKQVGDSERPNTGEAINETNSEQNFEPSQSTIDVILNYSKSISVQKTNRIGGVFTSLN